MRTQACRDNIQKAAEICGLSPETIKEIERVSGFVKDHPEAPHICVLTTDAIKPLMAISDPEKQQEAISIIEKTLNRKTPTGGIIKKRLSKPEVEKAIEKVSPTLKPELSGVATTRTPVSILSAPVPVNVAVSRKTVESLFEEALPLMNKKYSDYVDQIKRERPDLKSLQDIFTESLFCLVSKKVKL